MSEIAEREDFKKEVEEYCDQLMFDERDHEDLKEVVDWIMEAFDKTIKKLLKRVRGGDKS